LADYRLEKKLQKAFDFLTMINQGAYKSVYMLSNEVLSKNPFSNNFLERFLKEEQPELPGKFIVLAKLVKYYFRNIAHFGIYLLFFSAFYISRLRFIANSSCNELILIDTYTLIDALEKSKTYEDPYFPGLREALKTRGKHYAYLPVFYFTKNPFRLLKIFNILKNTGVPVLTEYQLLSVKDFINIFYFILIYPISVLTFINKIDEDSYESKLLKSEIINNLADIAYFRFSRYLQGKNISRLSYESIKLISWYENQTIDKNLYKGVRDGGGKTKIYGAQPFLAPRIILNVLVDESEVKFGIVPDKILVNGSYFMPKETNLDFEVGASFRYKKIFTTIIDRENQNNILILLSHLMEDTLNILNVVGEANLSLKNIIVKVHPSAPIKKIKSLFPANTIVNDDDLYGLFKKTKIVIGAASGSLVEAASLGIPVISIKNIERFDYNSLPSYGKGVIWDEVVNNNEFEKLLTMFESALKNTSEKAKIKKVAEEYKNMFFCPPTDKNIMKAYDLNK